MQEAGSAQRSLRALVRPGDGDDVAATGVQLVDEGGELANRRGVDRPDSFAVQHHPALLPRARHECLAQPVTEVLDVREEQRGVEPVDEESGERAPSRLDRDPALQVGDVAEHRVLGTRDPLQGDEE